DRLADHLNLGHEEVAQGIIDLATVNMARAIRVISVERGYDPRDYALVAFGGAGPLHAARLARELDIPRIVVPAIPGILCAYGLLVADLRTDYSRTVVVPASAGSLATLNDGFAELQRAAADWFEREGMNQGERASRRIVDMRYVGQNYELSIELPARALDASDLPAILTAFHHAHDQAYGYAAEDEPAQFVTLRLEATGRVPKPEPRRIRHGGQATDALAGTRRTFLPETGGWNDVPLFDRTSLPAGAEFDGPAIVEQMDSTTLILPGQQASVDDFGNLILTDNGLEG
ncbi:MAG TPA: hydantoinase/oxoprolinase family protein, partial [Nitrolancea sp.]|nr:hydantoinase/oxoprolinase family protein [Nitrolancea sp.]